jgi:hypothetical protein
MTLGWPLPVRALILATLLLAVTAPSASAAVTVDMQLDPSETRWGTATNISGKVLTDGAPLAGQEVRLEGVRYPYDSPEAVLDTAVTAADGSYHFKRRFDRNWQVRVTAGQAASKRQRLYVFPRFRLSFVDRSEREVALTQRYRVPRGVKLTQPTIFYVARRRAATGRRAATAETKRTGPGRYRSTAVVRIPAAWNGRFRWGTCFRYSVGSGMGNPRAKCPQRIRF